MGFPNPFRKRQEQPGKIEQVKTPEACLHPVLSPRWDRAEDIGHDELATGYICTVCAHSFSVEEGRELRARRLASAS